MAEFRMPSLGSEMEAGTLIAWQRKIGDTVSKGDIIADVETDKGIIEVEVFTSGVIDEILVTPGTRVPVGTPLAIIREPGEAAATSPLAPPTTATPPPPMQTPGAKTPPLAPAATGPAPRAVRASPLARKRARELGIDLATVTPAGADGVIHIEDVERMVKPAPAGPIAAAEPKPAAAETASRTARMRKAIGAAMERSKRTVPHFYLTTTVDMAPALAWIATANEKRAIADRFVPGLLFYKAVALALRRFPELNAHWTGEAAPPLPDIHVGVAVSLRDGGLLAPALHHTDRQSLDELMTALRSLVERARSGALRSSEMSDGTITVTSLGERGVEAVYPIIFAPQVAILGVGKIVTRPWVVDGKVEPRPLATIVLAADHRVTDGHRAGRFLAAVESLLQEPSKL